MIICKVQMEVDSKKQKEKVKSKTLKVKERII